MTTRRAEAARDLGTDADRAVESGPDAAVCLFRSLADPTRLAILRHLTLGEHRVVDLTAHLGMAQSTVSQHLACLRDCGLVTSRPHGRASMFSLSVLPELMGLLTAAEHLLAATGDAVTLCPLTSPATPVTGGPATAPQAPPPPRRRPPLRR